MKKLDNKIKEDLSELFDKFVIEYCKTRCALMDCYKDQQVEYELQVLFSSIILYIHRRLHRIVDINKILNDVWDFNGYDDLTMFKFLVNPKLYKLNIRVDNSVISKLHDNLKYDRNTIFEIIKNSDYDEMYRFCIYRCRYRTY